MKVLTAKKSRYMYLTCHPIGTRSISVLVLTALFCRGSAHSSGSYIGIRFSMSNFRAADAVALISQGVVPTVVKCDLFRHWAHDLAL